MNKVRGYKVKYYATIGDSNKTTLVRQRISIEIIQYMKEELIRI